MTHLNPVHALKAPQRPTELTTAFAQLRTIYDRLNDAIAQQGLRCDQSGVCCDFTRMDHRLYASLLEVAYFLAQSDDPLQTGVPLDAKHCPYFMGGKCLAREGRVLGCRTFFCMAKDLGGKLYEDFYNDIRALHSEHNLEYGYVPVFAYLTDYLEDHHA